MYPDVYEILHLCCLYFVSFWQIAVSLDALWTKYCDSNFQLYKIIITSTLVLQ